MKIDTSTIEGYENMTAEEKLSVLEAFEYDDQSEELERQKRAVSKANSEAAEWKRKHNKLLSEEDRAKAEREEKDAQIMEELEALRKEKKLLGYKENFISNGFDKDTAEKAANALTDGDLNSFFTSLKSFFEAHDKALKAELLKKGMKPEQGDPENPLTKDEIFKIEDPVERQRAIAANLHLFEGE